MNNYENIPQELKSLPQWVCFCYEEKDGRKTKVLKIPGRFNRNGEPVNASSTKPESWRPYQSTTEIYQAYAKKYDGIGFVLKPGGGYVFIDIDKCVDDTGRISDNAQQIIDKFSNTYIEKSVSGKGYHILCKGCIDNYIFPGKTGSKTGKTAIDGIKEIEVYQERRFLTFTGNVSSTSNNAIAESQVAIDWLFATYPSLNKRKQKNEVQAEPLRPRAELNLSDGELVDRIRKSKQGGKFSMLYDVGDTSGYSCIKKDGTIHNNDHSGADMALAEMIAWWTQDAAQIERIFSASQLAQREKWQRKDYRDMTVKQAIDNVRMRGNGYDPAAYAQQKRQEEIINFFKERNEEPDETLIRELFYKPCTDAGNMERLYGLYGGEWLFNCENEKNKSWLQWIGTRWLAGNGSELTSLSIDAMRMLQAYGDKVAVAEKEAEEKSKTDEEKDKHKKNRTCTEHVAKFLYTSENKSKLASMKQLFADCQTVHSDLFDKNGWLLNVQNGTLDLKAVKLLPHNREDYITKICNADYLDSEAPGNLWETTVQQTFPDPEIRQWVQRFFGYCLIGEVREHMFVIFYGEGGTGKGTICESIADVLGDYASNINVDVLLTGRDESGNSPTSEIAKLTGKRLVLASESNRSRRFNEAKIKLLTGGDKVSARAVYGQPFEYYPVFKVILETNYLPTIADSTDKGMTRRLYIVPFEASFTRDPSLRSKLKAERNNILRYLIDGCRLYQQYGVEQNIPSRMMLLKEKYFKENDIFELWLESCCRRDPKAKVKTVIAHGSFNSFATAGNYRATVGIKTFNEMARRHGFKVDRDNETTKIFGLCLNDVF